jgi:hypothetical protein
MKDDKNRLCFGFAYFSSLLCHCFQLSFGVWACFSKIQNEWSIAQSRERETRMGAGLAAQIE